MSYRRGFLWAIYGTSSTMILLTLTIFLFTQVVTGRGNRTQCYKGLGCFPMQYPWTSILRPLPPPQHPRQINTSLYCYSRKSPHAHNVVLWPTISVSGDYQFRGENKTTVLVTHGFINDARTLWLRRLKDAYLESVDANVCLVDWGDGAKNLNYLQVASNTRVVGAEVARFVKYLRRKHRIKASNLHLIGHSLGAHIMGYVAKAVHGVNRVTGLDAAQPGFEGCDKRVRLDNGDAEFVDGIHTNGAPLIPTMGFGFMTPFGHVDFYMNGGLRQPNCDLPNVSDIKSIADLAFYSVEMISRWVACSHQRAIDFFTQAIRPNCTIWGRAGSVAEHVFRDTVMSYVDPLYSNVKTCDINTCIPLGLDTPKYQARGTFASCTAGAPPFCDSPEVSNTIHSEILQSISKVASAVTAAVNNSSARLAGSLNKHVGYMVGRSDKITGSVTGRVTSDLSTSLGNFSSVWTI